MKTVVLKVISTLCCLSSNCSFAVLLTWEDFNNVILVFIVGRQKIVNVFKFNLLKTVFKKAVYKIIECFEEDFKISWNLKKAFE
jgi:hypothetical protein